MDGYLGEKIEKEGWMVSLLGRREGQLLVSWVRQSATRAITRVEKERQSQESACAGKKSQATRSKMMQGPILPAKCKRWEKFVQGSKA